MTNPLIDKMLALGVAQVVPVPPKKTRSAALKALQTLKDFMGPTQRAVCIDCFRGEERQFFYDKVCELAAIVEKMPSIRESERVDGKSPIAWLRYFAGGQATWHILEKDCVPGEPQLQAFGWADLFGDGTSDCAEAGYISIAEILESGGELDFHYTPKPLDEIRKGRGQ